MVVIYDGSIDDTKRIVELYYDKIQLLYIYEINTAKLQLLDLGVEKVKGQNIFMINADDCYLPYCFATIVASLEKYINVIQVSHLAYRLKGILYLRASLKNFFFYIHTKKNKYLIFNYIKINKFSRI